MANIFIFTGGNNVDKWWKQNGNDLKNMIQTLLCGKNVLTYQLTANQGYTYKDHIG